MTDFSLTELLQGIKDRDHKTLTFIYKEYFPSVRSYVVNNSGNEDDAKDVFQEGLMIIFKQLRDGKLEIQVNLKVFLVGVCKRIWLKVLRSRDVHERSLINVEKPDEFFHPDDKSLEEHLEMSLLRKHFLNLGEECQKVLTLTTEGVDYDEIAKQMGYKSEKIVRNKKYKCKNYLTKMIKKDPAYKKGF